MNDQIQRDVAENLPHPAVDPDRPAGSRRFGRATPWLIGVALLVVAGLGVAVALIVGGNGSGDGQAAVAPPRASGTADPAATTGTRVETTTPPTPTTPEASATVAPTAADLGAVAGIGSYGPLRVGMTRAEVQAALGLEPKDTVAGYGTTCQVAVPLPGTGLPGRPPRAIVDDSAGGTVIGFETVYDMTDAYGNTAGTTLAQLRASYPEGQLVQRQAWTFTVLDGSGNGLGFAFGLDEPTADSTVAYLLPGTAEYASGDELCIG